MRSARAICYEITLGHVLFLTSAIMSHQLRGKQTRLESFCSLNYSCTDRSESLNAQKGWRPFRESYLPIQSTKISSSADIRLVEDIIMDGNIVGMMHLDVKQVSTDSQSPLKISFDSGTGIVSGHFFNFYDHKPTFKLDAKDQTSILLTGGSLTAPYVMDQFHFHIYCTRAEAELNTLDQVQVPGELHLVFFRRKYQSYNKAMHKFQDGLAVISIYLEVGEDFNITDSDDQIAYFLSYVDYISQNENHTVPTTTSVKQLAAPVLKEHAQYDAYRGKLVEPIQCSDCVDVLVMKERFKLSVKQLTEFRKAPHCVENDWGF
uniref:carbonic anhydrase n=1 Tax=Stylophora pistillata TaxID=50429 RepID=A0A1B0Y439_STYPI|nr:alpha carbonic anhydrase 7 [Stylophora pistillata]